MRDKRLLAQLSRAVIIGLLQTVTANLRGVTAGLKYERVYVVLYYEGNIISDNKDCVENVAAEVRDEFPEPYEVIVKAERVDVPGELIPLQIWCFLRKEGLALPPLWVKRSEL